MKWVLFVVGLAAGSATGQTLLSITDTGGDGTNCTFTKVAGTTVELLASCSGPTGSLSFDLHSVSVTTPAFYFVQLSKVSCVVSTNNSTSPGAADGSIPTVPASGAWIECSASTAGSTQNVTVSWG